MSEPNLHELAARLARGEEAAFAELYDASADRLHHYLTVRLASREAASDVLQTTFVRAVQNRRRFRIVDNPIAYLFQIARNEAARATGKRRRQNERQFSTDDSFVTSGDSTTDDQDLVATALDRLDSDDRELVELKIYAGLKFHEIADMTGRPQGTVATQYRRALESLRPWLAKQFR